MVADALDCLGAKGGHRPVARAAADAAGEIAEQPAALRRVHDLRMKQHAVEAAVVVGDCGVGRARARCDGAEAGRQGIDLVAVAHPHLLAGARRPQILEQAAIAGHVDKGAAEFLVLAQRDPAAELGAQRLHAVADAEDGHAEPEHDFGRARRVGMGHRGRPAGQDDAARFEFLDAIRAAVYGQISQ